MNVTQAQTLRRAEQLDNIRITGGGPLTNFQIVAKQYNSDGDFLDDVVIADATGIIYYPTVAAAQVDVDIINLPEV